MEGNKVMVYLDCFREVFELVSSFVTCSHGDRLERFEGMEMKLTGCEIYKSKVECEGQIAVPFKCFWSHKVKRSMYVEIKKKEKKMVKKVSIRETRGGEILKQVGDRLRRYCTKESGNVQRKLVFQVYKIIRPTIGESAYKGRL